MRAFHLSPPGVAGPSFCGEQVGTHLSRPEGPRTRGKGCGWDPEEKEASPRALRKSEDRTGGGDRGRGSRRPEGAMHPGTGRREGRLRRSGCRAPRHAGDPPHRGAGARLTAARCANAPRARRPVCCGFSAPHPLGRGRGAEPALEKLRASQRLGLCLCLLKTSREPAAATEGLGWAGRSAGEASAGPCLLAFRDLCFPLVLSPGEGKRSCFRSRAGLGSREGSSGSGHPSHLRAARGCSPSPHLAPRGPRGLGCCCKLGKKSRRGPGGWARGRGRGCRGARGERVDAARRGWAPSGLCPASRTPRARRVFGLCRAPFPRRGGCDLPRGPEHPPPPRTPPSRAASPPPPRRHYPAAPRGRWGGGGGAARGAGAGRGARSAALAPRRSLGGASPGA